MAWETTPDQFVVETRDDEPGVSLRAEPGFESNAERLQDVVTGLRSDNAAAAEVELFETSDPGFPVATTSTTTEVVFNRITIPAASYARLLTITSSQMMHYSQIEAYDARLYVGSVRIDINRRYDSPSGVFRTMKLDGQAFLAASAVGVVEVRHARAGGSGLVTPSVGAGSYYLQVSTRVAG